LEAKVTINWNGLGSVLLVGLIAGVGLVAVFAAGVRALSLNAPRIPPDTTDAGYPHTPPLVARVIAGACFLVCAAVGAYGLYLLIKK
jgi:hypothetical protein